MVWFRKSKTAAKAGEGSDGSVSGQPYGSESRVRGGLDTADESHGGDEPIRDPVDDLLGRQPFAAALAADVRLAPRESGFVIGLTGEWGGGKTSVLELVDLELQDYVSAVVRFNPWLFSGTEQLVTYFFEELSGQVKETAGERLAGVSRALSAYGRAVSPLRYVPYVGEIIKMTGEVATDLSGALETPSPSVREEADRLRVKLAALDRPIVILVDDLDRLNPEEIVDVMRLVRLVGDFPNLIYVVAFDRAIVEAALGGGAQGHAYLEKIIQVSHELPPIRHEDLTAVMQSALAEAIPHPEDYQFDRDRFESLFWSEVRLLFGTVRDVRRFVNLLRTTLELVGDEVDLADVLALEALRLLEPEAFDALVAARHPLTGTDPPMGERASIRRFTSKDESSDRELVEKIAAAAQDRQQVESVVGALFPRSERFFNGPAVSAKSEKGLAAQRRVAVGEVFDIYLHRRLAPGAFPSRNVVTAVGLLGDSKAIGRYLGALDADEVKSLYNRLLDYEEKVRPGDLKSAIEAIMDRGVGFSGSFTDMSGSLLVRGLLTAAPREDLLALVKGLDYPSLSRRYDVIRMVGSSGGEAGLIGELDETGLIEDLVRRTLEADAASLADEDDLGPLIHISARGDLDGLRSRLQLLLRDDRFFVSLIAAHKLTKSVGKGHRSVQLNWFAVQRIADSEALRDGLERIDQAWVEAEFDADASALWQQALRYIESPSDADEDLRGYRLPEVEELRGAPEE